MTSCLIGLGSNLGDRLAWLRFGYERLAKIPGTRVLSISPTYETNPVGGPRQGKYLNACAILETTQSAEYLLGAVRRIEDDAGRQRVVVDGPRTLDLDILLFGEETVTHADLMIPHRRFTSRAFALVPAADIAPTWRVPPTGTTIATLAAAVDKTGVRPFLAAESSA